jgi:hypothetical protein
MRFSARLAVVLLKVNGVIFIWAACAESALRISGQAEPPGWRGVKDFVTNLLIGPI